MAILFGLGAGSASADATDLAVAYQINVAHSGVQTDLNLNPPFARSWQVSLPAESSYPLIADGDVYVTVGDNSGAPKTLYALDQATGSVVWSQPIPGVYPWSNAAYDAGRVFVVSNDVSCCNDGLMKAFDAATGTPLWTAQLPGQYSFSSPPTASNGVVYTSGAGSSGTLYAVDENTGSLLAATFVENGDHSSPALSSSSVFVSYACDQAYGFMQQTLASLWHYSPFCEGGGGKTPTYADGDVFVRDFSVGNLILNATSGNLIRSFAPQNTYIPAPAVDSNSIFVVNGGVLSAQDLVSGTVKWSFSGDGQLDSAPIVIGSAAGEVVIEGSGSGKLYALDATSGSLLSITSVGAAIPAPDEQNVSQPLTGLGAGQGLLVVPTGNVLTAYTGTPTCAPSAPSTISSSFNPTSIAAGRTIWFSSVLKASGLGKYPVTVKLTDAEVTFSANSTPYTVNVPNATVTFTPGAKSATTSYNGTTQSWGTTVPSSVGGNVFLSGVGFPVPTSFPGAISPVSFTATLTSSTPGVAVKWNWAAAVYKSFSSNPSQLGVKPVSVSTLSTYHNADQAGTPEAYKSFVTAGARGSGGANYTGGDYGSGTNVTACVQ